MPRKGVRFTDSKWAIEEYEFRKVNEFRVSMGLRPLRKIKRNCLRCKKEFEAIENGSGNFLCGCTLPDSDNWTF